MLLLIQFDCVHLLAVLRLKMNLQERIDIVVTVFEAQEALYKQIVR